MADYYPLIARAVAELDSNTVEARRVLYNRAREALVKQVGDELILHREAIALEDAIKKIEASVRALPASLPQYKPAPSNIYPRSDAISSVKGTRLPTSKTANLIKIVGSVPIFGRVLICILFVAGLLLLAAGIISWSFGGVISSSVGAILIVFPILILVGKANQTKVQSRLAYASAEDLADMVTEGNSVISEETRIAANQILLQRNINQQSVPFVASEVKTRKRFFHNEDYWPFVCGGLILFPIAFLFAIQLTSLWISIPLSEADPYEVLLWGIGSSIVLIYCHNRSGEFLFGRWLWIFIIFIIFLGIRSRSGGSFLFYFPSGIIPLLLFEASGWLGILIGRVTGVTKRFMSIESLVEASTTGELPRVQALLAARVDVNGQMANNPVVAGATALMMASRNGHLEVARALLAAKADVNAKAVRGLLATGTDALILASKYGHLEVVRALLAAKADVNAKTADGVTAYAIASQNGHRNIAELLRHHGGHQ